MIPYIEFTFQLFNAEEGEIVTAFLSQYPFEAFEDNADGQLVAYIQESLLTPEQEAAFLEDIAAFCNLVSRNTSEPINWNKEWEKNFDPIEIDDLCRIYTPFHEYREGFKHTVKIQPKMAFGTGHHATTRMMIKMMDSIDLKGKHLLDFGCGSGILGILAAKIGAETVLGIDVEPWAIENSRDNAMLNDLSQAHFSGKDIAHLVDEKLKFDIILANIQLDVLVTYRDHIKNLLIDEQSLVMVSGVLEDFREDLEQSYSEGGFKLMKTLSEEQWICQLYGLR